MLGIRSGFKTSTNVVTDRPLPGDLKNLAGVTVSAWHALPPEVSYPFESTIPELQGQAGCWAESLSPLEGTETLAQYSSGPFQSLAALTRHSLEAGEVYYLGIYPGVEQAQALIAHLAANAGLATLPSLSKSLVVQRRGEQMLVFNFSEQPQTAYDKKIQPRHVEIIPNLSSHTGEDR
jgi:beta-galactosidase